VAAFTRIAKEPIRERGVILHPNLVVIADESLSRVVSPLAEGSS
jgi:Pyruvate/2-oxoacid:ferredoxin oxidoreductase gamma subunit